MSLRPYRAALAVSVATIALATAAAPAAGHPAAAGALATAKNANFKGHWHMSNSQDFIVKKENAKTGKCKGKTTLGTGYKFVDCKVTGHHYRFHITYGSGYVSYNAGTFTKHSLQGHWHDNDGASGTYTATRAKVK